MLNFTARHAIAPMSKSTRSIKSRTYAQVIENRTAESAEKPVRWAG
ncbi:hypothetical protein [Nostoc sp.]